MRSTAVLIILSIVLLTYSKVGEAIMTQDNSYQFSFSSINGKSNIPLTDFTGKVILVVNTASNCSFTKQYKGLETLYTKYKEQGLVIIGVPSNDFGGQEPGNNEEVEHFCSINYGVSFPMTGKEIVSGKNAHPFYLWAREKLGLISTPKWNFHKYLINRKGELVDYYYSPTTPENARLIAKIEKLLKESAK